LLSSATPEFWTSHFYGKITDPASSPAEATTPPSVGDLKKEAYKLRKKIWGESFEDRVEYYRKKSVYGGLNSWSLRQVIVKGGDDVRQELLASQLIVLFKKVFDDASLPLWLKPYEVIVTGSESGLIEFVNDTVSVDSVKKQFPAGSSLSFIFESVFSDQIQTARQNFIESLAAYCIVCYILQVRDRHNGNLLLDRKGHLIHIDFGFMLNNTPGNFSFESGVKLTSEYLEIMGGEKPFMESFSVLMIRGILEARKHHEQFLLLVQLMGECGNTLPCFGGDVGATVKSMRDRFFLNLPDDACLEKILELIDSSLDSWRNNTYDSYQRLTNGIL
jgi:phosphatidylinositol 4-kinase B